MQNSQAKHMALGQLYTNEITDKRILQAMTDVPRENFVPVALKGAAYVDEDLNVGSGRFLLAPLSFAQLLTLAEINTQSRVLVIGALSGYAAAVTSKLAQQVVAVETDAAMLAQARTNCAALGITNIDFQQVKSLADGYALSAPYDAIIVCGGVEAIPEDLGAQLSIGGRLSAIRVVSGRPGIAGGLGRVVLVTRVGGQLQYRDYFDASSALLPEFKYNTRFSL